MREKERERADLLSSYATELFAKLGRKSSAGTVKLVPNLQIRKIISIIRFITRTFNFTSSVVLSS